MATRKKAAPKAAAEPKTVKPEAQDGYYASDGKPVWSVVDGIAYSKRQHREAFPEMWEPEAPAKQDGPAVEDADG